MLFYRNKQDKRLVRAFASSDSKQVNVLEKDGSSSVVETVEFANTFDKVDPQLESFEAYDEPAPAEPAAEPVAEEAPESAKGKKAK
jgi:hypothetical protein